MDIKLLLTAKELKLLQDGNYQYYKQKIIDAYNEGSTYLPLFEDVPSYIIEQLESEGFYITAKDVDKENNRITYIEFSWL